MEYIVVNGSVHTACKQHQRVCVQMCLRVLCERGLRIIGFSVTHPQTRASPSSPWPPRPPWAPETARSLSAWSSCFCCPAAWCSPAENRKVSVQTLQIRRAKPTWLPTQLSWISGNPHIVAKRAQSKRNSLHRVCTWQKGIQGSVPCEARMTIPRANRKVCRTKKQTWLDEHKKGFRWPKRFLLTKKHYKVWKDAERLLPWGPGERCASGACV